MVKEKTICDLKLLTDEEVNKELSIASEVPNRYGIINKNASNRALVISEYFPDIDLLERVNYLCNNNEYILEEFMQLDITDSNILVDVTRRVSELAIGCIIVDNSSGRLEYLDDMTISLFREYDVEIIDASNFESVTNKYIASKDSENNAVLFAFGKNYGKNIELVKQMVKHANDRGYDFNTVYEIQNYDKAELLEKVINACKIKNSSIAIIPYKDTLQLDDCELFNLIQDLMEYNITLDSATEGYIDLMYFDEEIRQSM